jgi:hypothetical protein
MRLLVLATATALGVGLLGTSGASAAPANGIIIDRSATVLDQAVMQEVGHSRWRSMRRGMRERYDRFRHRGRDRDRDRGRDRDRDRK